MQFANKLVKISQLIADTITGVTINGSTINGGTIIGAILETAASGARWVITTTLNPPPFNANNTIVGYSGMSHETDPATIIVSGGSAGGSFQNAQVEIDGPILAVGSFTPILRIKLGWNENTGVLSKGPTIALEAGDSGIEINASGVELFGANAGSTPIKGVDFGGWSGTTNASGQILNIAHGLGRIPSAVLLNHYTGSGSGNPRAIGYTSTNFDIQVNDTTTGGALVGAAMTGQFFAIG